MSNSNIERYRGRVPTCRNCGSGLRPNYETVREDFQTGASGTRWAVADDLNNEDLCKQFPDAVNGQEVNDDGMNRVWVWHEKTKKWRYKTRSYKVKSRRWLGTFGVAGNGFFCSEACGYNFAVKVCKRNA